MPIKTENGYIYEAGETGGYTIPLSQLAFNTMPSGGVFAVANPEFQTANFAYGHIWQLCPKCNGDGDLYRYNSPTLLSTNARPICDVCNGKKIISSVTGLPPQ